MTESSQQLVPKFPQAYITQFLFYITDRNQVQGQNRGISAIAFKPDIRNLPLIECS